MKYEHESAPIFRFLGKDADKRDVQRAFRTVAGADFGVGIEGIPYMRGSDEHRSMDDIAEAICEQIQNLELTDWPLEEIAVALRGNFDLTRTQANVMLYRHVRKSDLPHFNATLLRNKLLDESEIETHEKVPEIV